MNSQLTFREICKYIQALKTKCILSEIKGNEIQDHIQEGHDNNVLIIRGNAEQAVALIERGRCEILKFVDGEFEKRKAIRSLERYEKEEYSFWVYEIDYKKLLCFLHSTPQTLEVSYEDINFELGFRLRKSLLAKPGVAFVIFFWENGPLLLCEADGENENFYLSSEKGSVSGENALNIIRDKYSGSTCAIKTLFFEVEQDIPSVSEEDIELEDDMGLVEEEIADEIEKQSEYSTVKEESVVTLDEPLPTLAQEDKEVFNKYGISMDDENKTISLPYSEESVVVKDEELPMLGPDDMDILSKYGIPTPGAESKIAKNEVVFEQSEIPLDEAPAFSNQELKIFEKYGVDVSKKEKTTFRELREAFEDSVVVKDDELPSLNREDEDILRKYGISIVPKKKKEGELINKADSVIFQFYGIKLPDGENTTIEELKIAFNNALLQKRIVKRIHKDDRRIFERYNLELPYSDDIWGQIKTSRPMQQIQRVNREITKRVTKEQFQEAIVQIKKVKPKPKHYVATVAAVSVIYILIIILGLYQVYKNDQERIAKSRTIIGNIATFRDQLIDKKNQISDKLQILEKLYPSSQGFPEANPKIRGELKNADQYTEQLASIISEIEGLLEEDSKKALSQLQVYANQMDKGAEKNLDNIIYKTDKTMEVAEFMKTVRDQEITIRKALRKIREHMFAYTQQRRTIGEIYDQLLQDFPAQEGYPKPPAEVDDMLIKADQKVKDLATDFNKIERAMLSDEMQEALTASQPYIDLGEPDISEMESMEEVLSQRLEICKNLAIKKEKRKEGLAVLDIVKGKLDKLQEETTLLEKGLSELQNFPDALTIPKLNSDVQATKSSARKAIDILTQALEEGRKHLYQNEFSEALARLEPHAKDDHTLLTKVQQAKENVSDIIKIANSAKEKSEQGMRIAFLLQETKEKLLPLRDLTQSLENKITLIKRKFPTKKGFPALDRDHEKAYRISSKITKRLDSIVQKVESDIKQERLSEAIRDLQNARPLLGKAESSIRKAQSQLEELNTTIKKYTEIVYNRQQSIRIERRIKRLKSYLDDLQSHIYPMEKNIQVMTSDYPSSEGYPEIPDGSASLLEKSKGVYQELQKAIETSLKEKEQRNWEASLDILIPYFQGKIDSKLLGQVSKTRYELDDLVHQASRIAKDKDTVLRIKGYIKDMSTHHKELKELHGSFRQTLASFPSKYPTSEGFVAPPVGLNDILKQGEMEIGEIANVIGDSEDAFHLGNYKKALSILEPYAENIRSWSRLPVMKTYWDQIEQLIAKNEKIASDPEYKAVLLKQRQKQEELKKLKESWIRSPDLWYDELRSNFVDDYKKIQERLSVKIVDKGASFIFGNINVQIKEIDRYPHHMAEIDELIYYIKEHGGNIDKMLTEKEQKAVTQSQLRRAKQVRDYQRNGKIPIDINEEIRTLRDKFTTLKDDLENGRNLKDPLKDILRDLKSVTRKYDEEHKEILSELINLKAAVK